MKHLFYKILPFLLPAGAVIAQNQAPEITNLLVEPDWSSQTLLITYDLSDAENDAIDLSVQFSDDAGKTYALTGIVPASGDLGYPVAPGTGKSITCDISALAAFSGLAITVKLVADDRQSFDLQQLVNEVDSNRLRADLVFVEGVRHRDNGAAHLQAVRDSLKYLFAQLQLHAEEQTFAYNNYTGRNIIGTMPGVSAEEKVVIVDAHYDTVINAPGADDNGSGTAGMMEIARLLSRYPAKKSLRFIGFDLEESGLVGSIRYVANGIPAGEKIEGVFNFEMIGYYSSQPNSQSLPAGFNLLFPDVYNQVAGNQFRGDFITNVGQAGLPSIATLFSASAASYVPDLKVVTVLEPVGTTILDLRRSDHTPFWVSGIPAVMLTDGANFRNKCYHTPQDTLDNKLNFTFMSNVVKTTLAAAAQLAEIQHGDWVTSTFQTPVGTREPSVCELSIGKRSGDRGALFLHLADCSIGDATLEMMDQRGALLMQQAITLPYEGIYPVVIPNLPAGVYVVKIRYAQGIITQRVILP